MREFNFQFRLKTHLECIVFIACAWALWHVEVSNFFFAMAYVVIYNIMAVRAKLRDLQQTIDDELNDADDWDLVPPPQTSKIEEAGRRAMEERNAAHDAQFRDYIDANWPPENRNVEVPRT